MATDPVINFAGMETEKRNPNTMDIDRKSALEIVQVMNDEDAIVAAAVRHELTHVARAVEAIADRLRGGGRLFYIGAGSSGRMAVYEAAECPSVFNTPLDLVVGWIAGGLSALTRPIVDVEDHADAGRADAQRLGVSSADALVGVTASGRTAYVLGAATYAKEQGALTIGVVCEAQTPMGGLVDIIVAPVVGPEVVSGSTGMKAGTAQKMVLSMLSNGAMILLGKTYGNLMVDVPPTNAKLRRRAVAIICDATDLPDRDAESLLRAADGEVKTAIVAALAGIDLAEARVRLARAGGVVRVALDDLSLPNK